MPATITEPLDVLYELDETAWLETMSALAAEGRLAEMDFANLREYLADMAKRDRREVFSRLRLLLAHLLKREYQADHRTGSWRSTILTQRSDLQKILDSGTLHNHAAIVLGDAYAEARKQAAAETELPRDTFPSSCPWDLETVLTDDDDAD
ncbi:MAG: DUF29 domain-containing protein [Gemmataceae bacterium]|nr:DUF29 domain-containing protein [Gemmataceae bacterium]